MYYKDLRSFIDALDKNGKLWRISRPINKDSELMPLVRWQYRGLPEPQRRGFLFEKVTDAKGRQFNAKVATAILGSTDCYAIALMCKPNEIRDRWLKAIANPIEPKIVSGGPSKEEIHKGARATEHNGLEEFPIPNSTPGFDPSPFLTAPNWVTKDPDTGVRNVGNYRAQIKGELKTGIQLFVTQHEGIHWSKRLKKGEPMEAAVFISAPPNVHMTSVAKLAYGLDEYTVSGGLSGEPVELVKCETVDLEVPATSEIVLEGEITVDYKEPEGPFGEYLGYMGKRTHHPIFNIKCITHRKNPTYYGYISQMPPSESSCVREHSFEAVFYKFLKFDCNIPSVIDVVFPQIGQDRVCIIRLNTQNPSQPWQALNAAVAFDPFVGKIIIAVDQDIDPRDLGSVLWAIYTRAMPHLDIRITPGKFALLDPSAAPATASDEEQRYPSPRGVSAMLINATIKHAYPPTSLPKREFMERARKIWEEEGLPPLNPIEPWFGYELGYWTDEFRRDAEAAVKGEYLHKELKLVEPVRRRE